MTETFLKRIFRFDATHRYWRADWSEARNLDVFGAQAHPHTHDYRVEVTLAGAPDRETGFIVDLRALDAVLTEILGPLQGGDLNRVIPEAREGRMLTSTEALAAWVWDRLEGRLPGAARLCRVGVWESEALGAEVTAGGSAPG